MFILTVFFLLLRTLENPFTTQEVQKFTEGWTQDEDERFLNYIRSRWLVAPSGGPLNVTLNGGPHFSQMGQSAYVDKARNKFIFKL